MIVIDDKVISTEVFEEFFCCDISKCKGYCCVHGDSGAPLEDEEVVLLEKLFSKIQPYLREVSIKEIRKQGYSVIDGDGDQVTPLVNGEECAYAVFEDGIAKCTIEKAYFDKKIKFRKPLSCHLYPIRINQLHQAEGLNYHRWPICKDAIDLGKKENIRVYDFLKDALIRKYGKVWYNELKKAGDSYVKYYRK